MEETEKKKFPRVIRKPEPTNVQGMCVVCKEEKQMLQKLGKYRALCHLCHNERYPALRKYLRDYMRNKRLDPEFVEKEKLKELNCSYRAFKKDHCEECGFVAIEPCQLDVDHIDGNRGNNDPSNLRTLCANCHRLKTYREKNFRKKKEIKE